MRGAPPVRMACGGDARWRLISSGLYALAAATACAWLAAHAGLHPAVALAGALFVGVAGWALAGRRASPAAREALSWDGQAWLLDGQPARVAVSVDLGCWMLLRVHVCGRRRARWLSLDLDACGAPAHLCRAVVHAHAGSGAGARRRVAAQGAHG